MRIYGNDKYELLDDDVLCRGNDRKFYRIKALKSFGNVLEGELGGYISSFNNLSFTGNCWVDFASVVEDNAMVLDNAIVTGKSCLSGNSVIKHFAKVINCYVRDNSCVSGHAKIESFGTSEIYILGNSIVSDYADVRNLTGGTLNIHGFVFNHAVITGSGIIHSKAYVTQNARLNGCMSIGKRCLVGGNTSLVGNFRVNDDVTLINSNIEMEGEFTIKLDN